MSDTPNPRPWFQLHLSTLVVVLIAAGIWIGSLVFRFQEIESNLDRLARELWIAMATTVGLAIALEAAIRRRRNSGQPGDKANED